MLTQPDSLLRYVEDASGLELPDGHFTDGKGWNFLAQAVTGLNCPPACFGCRGFG